MGAADSRPILSADFARMRSVSIPDDDNTIWEHVFDLPSSALVGAATCRDSGTFECGGDRCVMSCRRHPSVLFRSHVHVLVL
jgi:hypothetical protein